MSIEQIEIVKYTPSLPPSDWANFSECRTDTSDLMFTEQRGNTKGRSRAEMVAIGKFCRDCCVQEECFDDAMLNDIVVGIRGGTTDKERAPLHADYRNEGFVMIAHNFFEQKVDVAEATLGTDPSTPPRRYKKGAPNEDILAYLRQQPEMFVACTSTKALAAELSEVLDFAPSNVLASLRSMRNTNEIIRVRDNRAGIIGIRLPKSV